MRVEFRTVVFEWRGPSPFHFAAVPEDDAEAIRSVAGTVSYGYGMVPVTARIGETTWRTALFPKDGRYVLPLKNAVRRAERIGVGDAVEVRLELW